MLIQDDFKTSFLTWLKRKKDSNIRLGKTLHKNQTYACLLFFEVHQLEIFLSSLSRKIEKESLPCSF
jgi:hypothetical protein